MILQEQSGIKVGLRRATKHISSAIWWPAPERSEDSEEPDELLPPGLAEGEKEGRKRLVGEIHLPKDLTPSFIFGPFSLLVRAFVRSFRPFRY